MSAQFDISYDLTPRAAPRSFDEAEFEDASRLFLALQRLLALEEGQFQIRAGELVLPFDFDPDLSTVFDDLPEVLHALKGREGATSELHFFEQGTDLTFSMRRLKNDVEVVLHRGPSSGSRYSKVSPQPVTVALTGFLHAWAHFLEDVLAALRRVDPGIERDESYQAYAARISSLTSSNRFTVDTHLFRELGQLLVGRDSTALVELVKNAYDADAERVVVYGEALADPERGQIRVVDDGHGMTPEAFARGFLRIASRLKEDGDRRSPRYKRRYTGAKGIGRLAAHKLAHVLEVDSVPRGSAWKQGKKPPPGVSARIDWDQVEAQETLDDIEASAAIQVERRPVTPGSRQGTMITLQRLRQAWTKAQLGRFLAEVESLQAPELLVNELPDSLIVGSGLFACPLVRERGQGDPGFRIDLEGEFSHGDQFWEPVAAAAHWLVEIDAAPERIRYGVFPTLRTVEAYPGAEPRLLEEPHPDARNGPFFHARILIREGNASGLDPEVRAFAQRVAGIRVYLEGFRVLPYGEPTDDWLSIQRDTTDRDRRIRFRDTSVLLDGLPPPPNEGLLLLPNKHYVGAVFLTLSRAPTLSMLVNREGFIPDGSFEHLVCIVRTGIDLSTRVRASLRAGNGTMGRVVDAKTSRAELERTLDDLTAQAVELRTYARSVVGPAARKVSTAADAMDRAARMARDFITAQAMVRVLASVGTQLAAFTHEMYRLLHMAQAAEAAALRLKEHAGLPVAVRGEIGRLTTGIGELRRALDHQASYLVDLVTPDARRRRSRQKLAERFAAMLRLHERLAEDRGIQIRNQIAEDLRSPPMFQAELAAVFANLLTNAIKAAGKNGRIRATGEKLADGAVIVRIENTGVAVDLEDRERWFRPFESTTVEVDPVLGQGMGLGLGITRDILSEIGARIEFVPPQRGYATAIQITFPR